MACKVDRDVARNCNLVYHIIIRSCRKLSASESVSQPVLTPSLFLNRNIVSSILNR